jgi:hypothetical protein
VVVVVEGAGEVLGEPGFGLGLEHHAGVQVPGRGGGGAVLPDHLHHGIGEVEEGVGPLGHAGETSGLAGVGRGVLLVVQVGVVVKEHPVEGRVRGQVLENLAHDAPGFGLEGREAPVVGAAGYGAAPLPPFHRQGIVLPGVSQVEGQEGHPGEDPHAHAGAELPGHPVEEVGPNRQVTVREVERPGGAIALGVGEGLQVDVRGPQRVDPLEERVEVPLGLRRVIVVNVVQVHVHDADRRHGIGGAAEVPGQVFHRHVGGDHEARYAVETVHRVVAGHEPHGHGHAELAGHGFGHAAVLAVGPDHGPRGASQLLLDAAGGAGEVAPDAGQVRGLVFVAAGGGVVAPGHRGGLLVSEGVPQDATVKIEGVGRHLHEPRGLHAAELVPRDEGVGAQGTLAVVVEGPALGRILPRSHHGHHGRVVVEFEKGEDVRVDAPEPVVEDQEERAFRKRRFAALGSQEEVQVDGGVALGPEPLEMLHQALGRDGEAVGIEVAGHVVGHIVVREHLDRGDWLAAGYSPGLGSAGGCRGEAVSGAAPCQHGEHPRQDEGGHEGCGEEGPLHRTLQVKPRCPEARRSRMPS